MAIEKRIAYKEGSNKPESPKPPHEHLNGNVISIYPIPHEKPWWEDTKDFRRSPIKKLEGIMSQVAQMSNGDLRKFYGGYLIPYGYREEEIMKMPMDKLEYLFNTVMSI